MSIPPHDEPWHHPLTRGRQCEVCGQSIRIVFCQTCVHSFEKGHDGGCEMSDEVRLHQGHRTDDAKYTSQNVH